MYSIEDKQKVAALLAADMSVLSISKQTGIPYSTINVWQKKEKFQALVANLRDEKKDKLREIADECLDVAKLAVSRLRTVVPDSKNVQHLSIAAGTLLDKHLLLNGEPNQNIKISNLADLFRACDEQ